MGRLKHNVKGTAEQLAGQQPTGGKYVGPVPPRGLYRGMLRFLAIRGKKTNGKWAPQKNRNGDMMIRCAVSIKETGPKARYNSYLINSNQNVSDQGTPYINEWLDSISGGDEKFRKAFWDKFVEVDQDGKIVKIGLTRYTDNSVEVLVNAKDGKDNNGKRTLEVGQWLHISAAKGLEEAEDSEDDEESEDEDIEIDSDGDEDTDEDEASEFESGDDDSDNDEDEDEDEPDDEDSDEDDEDSDDDEDTDEDSEDDDSDDGEEDSGDSEDEAQEYDEEAKREEYGALSRSELVAKVKGYGMKAFKNDKDADLVDKIVEFEKEQPPF